MIHVPQDWLDKLMQGFNLSAHIKEIRSSKKQIMPGLQLWGISVVVAVVASWFGVWQRLAVLGAQALRASYPQITVVLTPTHFSNQLIWLVSWFAVALVVKGLLAGRSKTSAKSVWWYIARFLVTSVWVGGGMGLAIGVSRMVMVLGAKVMVTNFLSGSLVVHAAGAFIGFAASLFVLLYLLKATLNGMTFGAALLLQGKGLKEAYKRGSKMLNGHWPYIIGLYIYFVGMAYVLQLWIGPAVPVDSSFAVLIGGLNYILWPLYWAVFLPYHKRASRKK